MKSRKRVLDLMNENYRIKDYILKNNSEIILLNSPSQFLYYSELMFSTETYLLMFQLGIPIGIVEPSNLDKHYKDISKLHIDEKVEYIYFPLSSDKEYYECLSRNYSPNIIVNPSYMNDREVCNIAYCLELIYKDKIFEPFIQYKIQREIVNSLPLKYESAMKIFNRYFTEQIKSKIICECNITREMFYKLSGLNEEVLSFDNRKDIKYFRSNDHYILGEVKQRKNPKEAYDNAIKRGMNNPEQWCYLYSYNNRDYFANCVTRKFKSYPQFKMIETIKRKIVRER